MRSRIYQIAGQSWLLTAFFILLTRGQLLAAETPPNQLNGAGARYSERIDGKARVWVFLSAKCPCSNSHIEKINAAYRDFATQSFEFVGIHSNQDEPEPLARSYFAPRGILFPVFHDSGAKIADRLGAFKTPHVFIEGKDHQILYQGGVDDSKHAQSTPTDFLRDALTAIRDGRKVTKEKTRTLGCVISRK